MMNLVKMVGGWESICLNPTIWIYRQYGGVFRLVLVHINEHTKQATLAEYTICQDDDGYFIRMSIGEQKMLSYNPTSDTINLASMGEYLRN